jgi:hypothetical protein
MTAMAPHATSTHLAIAPASVAAPSASTTQRVAVSFQPPACRIVTAGRSHLSIRAKPAPTNLRL